MCYPSYPPSTLCNIGCTLCDLLIVSKAPYHCNHFHCKIVLIYYVILVSYCSLLSMIFRYYLSHWIRYYLSHYLWISSPIIQLSGRSYNIDILLVMRTNLWSQRGLSLYTKRFECMIWGLCHIIILLSVNSFWNHISCYLHLITMHSELLSWILDILF